MIQYIRKSCGLPSIKDHAIKLHEDNPICIAQIKERFIKCDRAKYISLKFFYTQEF